MATKNQTISQKIEQGRAETAYKYVKDDVLNAEEKNYLKVVWDKIAKGIIEKKVKSLSLDQNIKQKLIDFIVQNRSKDDLDVLVKQKFSNNQEINKLDFNDFKKELSVIPDEIKASAKEYKSYVKKVPMLIKNNGLAATFAFALSKNKIAWDIIYYQTLNWLKVHKQLIDKDDLMEGILDLNSPEYRTVTNEVLALFNWLRRFAEGLIEGEADE